MASLRRRGKGRVKAISVSDSDDDLRLPAHSAVGGGKVKVEPNAENEPSSNLQPNTKPKPKIDSKSLPKSIVEGVGQLANFQTIDLTDLEKVCIESLERDKKYLLIADRTGKAHTFFKYQAYWCLYELHADAKR